ncbi:MAG: hypothetical protein GQ523_04690 [Methanophagales archaeon]|jgi:uncharacterized protein YutE (UPF0331/DUF86 family)|nr:hypothetical protein [Methanophagales archaeon]NQE53680.1 hypothetical protein [ANME-1 cluster archaeon GoMg3.2]
MVSIKEKVHAEMENIAVVLAELEKVKDRSQKELVVLVGMGAYLQNIYTGMENILKQILLHKSSPIPDTPTWHKDLLNSAVEHNIITNEIADKIGKYLFFRHFFTHAYGFLLDEEKLKPLMDHIPNVYSEFKREIDNYLTKIVE